MSERNQNQSVSQAVQELSAQVERLGGKVATWEATLAEWGRVVSEELTTAQEQNETKAEERAEAEAKRWKELARKLLAAENAQAQEIQSQRQSLTDERARIESLTGELAALSRRREHQHAPWRWGLSRDRWKVVLVSAVVSVVMTLGAMTLYLEFGPPARERARLEKQNTTWLELWAATTEAERARIQKRAWPEAAPQK